MKIYLCDLVHNYFGAGTYMFPLNIGYIAAYSKKYFPKAQIELFKYPDDFMRKFKEEKPDIVGFSNYSWSADLNRKLANWIKSLAPETIVVFGGPNIDYFPEGYERFFKTCPSVDFYVFHQGETAFLNFLKKDFKKTEPIDGVIFYSREKGVVKGNKIPRIKNPDSVPSPYLTGILDKFFETKLIPIVETSRGCPYQCTYCCQGISSCNQIEFFGLERIKKELKYVAERVKNTNILEFADSNFGILERDIEIAKYLAGLAKENGYPRTVNANWAKNQPKIFEIAKILNNANLIISLQSLNEKVLKKIKRSNMKISVFRETLEKFNKQGGMSGTELILAMPGETKESHLQALRNLFDWNISYIVCYNCRILEGSELSFQKEKGEFKCQTKFRLIDNCFGEYQGIKCFEIEENVLLTSTMSEQQILYFRPVHWLIQFLWNYRFYYDLLKYLQSLDINPLDFIIKLIDEAENKAPEKVKEIFREFKKEAKEEWFDSSEDLRRHYSQPENFEWLKQGNYGKMNGKYIFKVLLEAKDEFEDYLYNTAASICGAKKDAFKEILNFISASIIDFRQEKEEKIFADKTIFSKYDFLGWQKSGYQKNLEEFFLSQGRGFVFSLPKEQKRSLGVLLNQYGHKNKNVTLRKMSELMDIRDFFMRPRVIKIAVFLVARLKSKRLPLKAIKPILGKPMIKWMIERLKLAEVWPTVMTTSVDLQDDPLVEIAKKEGIDYFRGSRDDVLVRMRDCARKFNVDLIIVVTGDNPLLDPVFIRKTIKRYFETKFDFCETKGLPLGFDVFSVSKRALQKACEIKKDTDTEMWAPYFKKTGIFNCDSLDISDPKITGRKYRLTVDEKEDFELVDKVFNAFSGKPNFSIYDVCELLDKNKDWPQINAHIKSRPDPKIELKEIKKVNKKI